MDDTVITTMKTEDIDEVFAAELTCFPAPMTREDYVFAMKEDCYRGFVARIGGALAGYVLLMIVAGEATLMRVAVLPEHRRRGIAIQLMQAAFAHCRRYGAPVCFLEVRASNDAAKRLYERLGFEPLGVRKDYYSSPVEDAVMMKKELCR